MQSFIKQSSESYPITMDFRENLPPNTSIIGGGVTAVDTADNSDQSAAVLVTQTPAVQGNPATQLIFTVRGGINGHQYKLTILGVLNSSPSSELAENILMVVSDL